MWEKREKSKKEKSKYTSRDKKVPLALERGSQPPRAPHTPAEPPGRPPSPPTCVPGVWAPPGGEGSRWGEVRSGTELWGLGVWEGLGRKREGERGEGKIQKNGERKRERGNRKTKKRKAERRKGKGK